MSQTTTNSGTMASHLGVLMRVDLRAMCLSSTRHSRPSPGPYVVARFWCCGASSVGNVDRHLMPHRRDSRSCQADTPAYRADSAGPGCQPAPPSWYRLTPARTLDEAVHRESRGYKSTRRAVPRPRRARAAAPRVTVPSRRRDRGMPAAGRPTVLSARAGRTRPETS
jgi:hypothetical protein